MSTECLISFEYGIGNMHWYVKNMARHRLLWYFYHVNAYLELVTERTIHVKYEDFVKDSQNTIKTLYDFTGLEWYDELNSQIPEQVDLPILEKTARLGKIQHLLYNKNKYCI